MKIYVINIVSQITWEKMENLISTGKATGLYLEKDKIRTKFHAIIRNKLQMGHSYTYQR